MSNATYFYVIKKIDDGSYYRIKKGKSSFKKSPGIGPSLFETEKKAMAILRQHLRHNIPHDMRSVSVEGYLKSQIKEYDVCPVMVYMDDSK